jgi:hypothetical protein
MLMWVNLHGSFMIGLLLPAAFLVEALFDPGIDRRRVMLSWLAFILAAWVVALLNPDGLAGVLFPVRLVGMKSLAWIGEWEPTDFSRIQPLELIILGFLALGLTGTITLPPMRLAMFLGLIHGALAHARNEQLLGIVGVLILAEPLGSGLGRGGAATLGLVWRWTAVAAAGLATTAFLLRVALPMAPERTGAAFAATLEMVPATLRARPVLNDYSLGGKLIFQGVRPFVDSRADLYGDPFLTEYRRVTAPNQETLDHVLADFDIAWTIFPPDAPIVAVLDQRPGWIRLLAANGVVIHARADTLPR